MKAPFLLNESNQRQHPDFRQRPDTELIWQHELVIDPKHPERYPAIKISRNSLWATIRQGLFPEPITYRERVPGWGLGAVREWILARDKLNPSTASPYDDPPDDVVALTPASPEKEAHLIIPPSSKVRRVRPTDKRADRTLEDVRQWLIIQSSSAKFLDPENYLDSPPVPILLVVRPLAEECQVGVQGKSRSMV